jgi:hypothetical protein
MIQLNTASLFGKQDSSNSMLPPSTETLDGNSFEKALTASIASNAGKYGIATNNATPPIAPATSEATAVPFAAASLPSAPAASATAVVSPFAAAATSVTPPVTSAPTGPDLPAPPASNDPMDSTQSFDDAYWAAQPAAVQQLRTMDDYTERTQLAAQLTAQGYNIDVPIMVYGWDPAKITAARESYGYTWVPSAMQTPVSEAPGISAPGGQAYDPTRAPSGSIAV